MKICKQKFVAFALGLAIAVVFALPGTGQAGDCPSVDVAHFKIELLELRAEYMAIANASSGEPMSGNEVLVLPEIDRALDQVDFISRVFDLVGLYCNVNIQTRNIDIWREVVVSLNEILRTTHSGNKASLYALAISTKKKNRYYSVVDGLIHTVLAFDKTIPRELL